MTETIQVEVDGVVEDGPTGRTPAWGFPAAVAIVSVLALVLIVRALAPGLGSGEGKPRDLGSLPVETTAPAATDARIMAAGEALVAWGRFASTGDLSAVDGWFDLDGPQYRTFVEERRAGTAGDQTPHVVTVSDATVVKDDGREAVVSVIAQWTRPGHLAENFTWDVVLRSDTTGRWIVWTVRDQPAGRTEENQPG